MLLAKRRNGNFPLILTVKCATSMAADWNFVKLQDRGREFGAGRKFNYVAGT